MRTLLVMSILLAAPTAFAQPAPEERAPAPSSATKPWLTLEASGGGAIVANPYIEYQGWKLETGQGVGGRVELNLVGIVFGYELMSFTNEKICGAGCMTGDYGSTRIHAFDLGYKYRFSPLGPVRPYLALALGGVVANSGKWTAATDRYVYGGEGRAGFGIEVPFTRNLYLTGGVFYRAIATENPLRNQDQQNVDKIFLGTQTTAADYVEDFHLVTLQVGIGGALE